MNSRLDNASQLASDALDDALAGRFEDAEPKIRAAVQFAVTVQHPSLPMYRSQLGGVLAELERHDEASLAYELAVQDALVHHVEGSPMLSICRYFLGEHHLKLDQPAMALQAVLPSLLPENHLAPLSIVVAIARWQLGEHDLAREAATRAIDLATTPEQADGFRARIQREFR